MRHGSEGHRPPERRTIPNPDPAPADPRSLRMLERQDIELQGDPVFARELTQPSS